MHTDDAGRIAEYLNAAFPREALEGDSLVVFVQNVALLYDAEIALKAAQKTARDSAKFPTIAEFRTTYRGCAEDERLARPALPEPRYGLPPTWVNVWAWARYMRKPKVRRAFPQEEAGFVETTVTGDKPPKYLSPAEYASLEREWQESGAPLITSEQMASMIGSSS